MIRGWKAATLAVLAAALAIACTTTAPKPQPKPPLNIEGDWRVVAHVWTENDGEVRSPFLSVTTVHFVDGAFLTAYEGEFPETGRYVAEWKGAYELRGPGEVYIDDITVTYADGEVTRSDGNTCLCTYVITGPDTAELEVRELLSPPEHVVSLVWKLEQIPKDGSG